LTGTKTERSSGLWWLTAPGGRSSSGKPLQVSRTVHGDKRLALDESAKLVTEVVERAGEATQARCMTVTGMLEQWLEYLTPLREPGTIRGYRQHAKAITAAFGSVQVSKVERPAVGPCLPTWLGQGQRRPDRGAPAARHHEQCSAPGRALGIGCAGRHGPGVAASDPHSAPTPPLSVSSSVPPRTSTPCLPLLSPRCRDRCAAG
jgi:hypothetical protein